MAFFRLFLQLNPDFLYQLTSFSLSPCYRIISQLYLKERFCSFIERKDGSMLSSIIEEALLISNYAPLLRVIISTVCIYISLIIILRFFGSRSVSSLSVYDLITSFAIGSTISTAMISKNVPYILGIVTIITLLLLQFIVSKLLNIFQSLTFITNPPPTVLYYKGIYRKSQMTKQRINQEEILQAIRKQGGCTSDQVHAVILESDGSLSVITSISPGYESEINKYL